MFSLQEEGAETLCAGFTFRLTIEVRADYLHPQM